MADPAGNVDIHCHILPGLDDGAPSMEVAREMARLAWTDGTTHLVATPHANYQFSYDPARNAALREELRVAAGDQPHLLLGCDFHLSYENVQDAIAHPGKYSINGGCYQLVEFPELFSAEAMEGVLQRLLGVKLVPVLTHPERNPVFQKDGDLAVRYVDLGCVVQVTASSFRGDFGKAASKAACDLLDRDLVHVLASDGHSTKHRLPQLSQGARFVAERRGEKIAAALVSGNPAAIIASQPLPYFPPPQRRRNSLRRLLTR